MANFNYIAYLGQANAPVQATYQPSLPAVTSCQQEVVNSSDLYLKVLSPDNKKEYRTVNLRGLHRDSIGTPAELKKAISNQCDNLNSENMEVGYYVHSKKVWINNRLDINDVWGMVDKGERVTLWCLDTTRESQKRKRDEKADEENRPKKKASPQGVSTVEERKSKAKENEERLAELHKDKWTTFQYKLWAEMLVYGTHRSFEEPPSASMFVRDKKRSSNNTSSDTVVIDCVMTAMNSLCQALVPKDSPDRHPMSSPLKKAQLRGMYIKQLNELSQLHDCEILNKEEYEEQRADLVKLMRQLNEN